MFRDDVFEVKDASPSEDDMDTEDDKGFEGGCFPLCLHLFFAVVEEDGDDIVPCNAGT